MAGGGSGPVGKSWKIGRKILKLVSWYAGRLPALPSKDSILPGVWSGLNAARTEIFSDAASLAGLSSMRPISNPEEQLFLWM